MSETSGGEMKFALGLDIGSFLSQLSTASGAAKTFLAALVGGGDAIANVFGQIEKGASLEHLSKRLGENVSDLYGLQMAFKAVGLEAADVGPVILAMQRALGGFNDLGEPTKDIFASLGLAVDELKQDSAFEAFQHILEKLAGLNASEAAAAARKIFGIGGGDALQAARSYGAFEDALRDATSQALLFGRNAPAFERIATSLAKFKNRSSGFFLEIAAGAAPGIQALLDFVNKTDLTPIGEEIGGIIGAIPGAIQKQKLGELIELTLTVGFENAVTAFALGLQKVAASLPSLFSHSLGFLGKSISGSISGDKVTGSGMLADVIIAAGGGLPGLPLVALKLYKRATDSIAGSLLGNTALSGLGLDTKGLFSGDAKKKLDALLAELAPELGPELPAPGAGAITDAGRSTRGFKSHEDVDALTRIGFFSGGNSQVNDFARETARNTRVGTATLAEMLKLTQGILDRMPGGFDSYANR